MYAIYFTNRKKKNILSTLSMQKYYLLKEKPVFSERKLYSERNILKINGKFYNFVLND